ncbi:unnamed protein product [Didymodactylos carnosus]|uniref:FLYWCH-type domain-containing protein n=2 Tax=Didymodactylos carnosus TaxID=1234261 RepID=A0A814IVT1_9BILA|nr:unnamed protein product [Didymodactylos carnosus]CAF3800821.1 unnamed protein product [Didymodactylos carnosus]
MAKVEISETGRKPAAQFEGYSYRLERHQTESISWKCREYGCPDRLNSLKGYTKPDLRTPHSHGLDPEKLAVEEVVVDMRKRCEHQLPYAVFQASSQVVTDPQIAAAIPSFESLKSTLYRHKGNKNEPSTPTSLRNLCIPDKYGKLCWKKISYKFKVQLRRTNNDVESWHSKLSLLLQTQPTVWRLIETLQAQYVLVQHDIERLRAGTYKDRKNLKYQKLNRTVQRITDNFNLGLTQLSDFVNSIS